MNQRSMFFDCNDNFNKHSQVRSILLRDGKQKESPLISIVIPTYRKLPMLKIALSSALRQKGNHSFEVIVVNDDPEDTTVDDFISSINVDHLKYYKNERNLGLFGNWNRCFTLASGQWVAILNDDDYLYDFYLEEVERILQTHPAYQALYIGHDITKIKTPEQAQRIFSGKERLANQKRRKIRKFKAVLEEGVTLSRLNIWDHFFLQRYTHPVGALFRKDKILELGGYQELFYPSSDWILNAKYTMRYNMYYLNKALGCRSEGINLSSNQATKLKFIEMDYLFREALADYKKLPLMHWYSCCRMHEYAKRMGILHKVKIKPIKARTPGEIERYDTIRKSYIKIRNSWNYVYYKIINKEEGCI